MFWLVLHSGRVQRLPEGGYKKTKEAGGHVERLLKGSKHPLHNPTTATITTTGEEKKKRTLRLRSHKRYIKLLVKTQYQTFTQIQCELKFKLKLYWSSRPTGFAVLNTALHQIHKTDSTNKQTTDIHQC